MNARTITRRLIGTLMVLAVLAVATSAITRTGYGPMDTAAIRHTLFPVGRDDPHARVHDLVIDLTVVC